MAAPQTDPELIGLFVRCERIGHLAESSQHLLRAMRAGETPLVALLETTRSALRPALGDGQDADVLIDAARRGGVADSADWWRRCMSCIRVADDALARRFEFYPTLVEDDAELTALLDFLLAPQAAGAWDPERDLIVVCVADLLEPAARILVARLRDRGQRRIVIFDPDGLSDLDDVQRATTGDAVFAIVRDLPTPPPRLLSFATGRAPDLDPEVCLEACRQADRATRARQMIESLAESCEPLVVTGPTPMTRPVVTECEAMR